MVKRKGFPTLSHTQAATDTRLPILIPSPDENPSPRKRRAGQRRVLQAEPELTSTSPDKNPNFVDGPEALRASVDVEEIEDGLEGEQTGLDVEGLAKQAEEDNTPSLIADDVSTSPLSDISDAESPTKAKKSRSQLAKVIGTQFRSVDDKIGKKTAVPAAKTKKEHIEEPILLDPELEGDEEADEEEIQAAISRPPPVDSDYLPLPWQGRLGYVRSSLKLGGFILTLPRLVYVPTCAIRTHQSSALEHAVLRLFSRIGIRSRILKNLPIQQRTGLIGNSLQVLNEGNISFRVLD